MAAFVGILGSGLIGVAEAAHLPEGAGHPGTQFRPGVQSRLGVVATISPWAGEAGTAVLERGGNAVDAAVAAAFMLGVTRPEMCGIGGGGYLLYRGADGTVAALDFREQAPANVTPATVGPPGDRTAGHATVLVPGFVAGLSKALAAFGTISLSDAIAPAEHIARTGFPVDAEFSALNAVIAPSLRLFPPAAEVYLVGGLAPYPPGAILVQEKYANSLALIQAEGPSAFYRGAVANLLARDMEVNANNFSGDEGLLTLADLAAYEAKWREPLVGTYRGAEVITMPPSTSGGVYLLETLNIMENFDVARLGGASWEFYHTLREAKEIAFQDRAKYMADPEFDNDPADSDFDVIPTQLLISQAYADLRAKEIDNTTIKRYPPAEPEGGDTSAIAVIDAEGNAVALNCSIGNLLLGFGVVAEGAGFLLNNHLTDFDRTATGGANEKNASKRPRSSQTPTIVVRNGEPVLVLGGGGGFLIPQSALHMVMNSVDFGMDVARSIDAERSYSGQAASIDGGTTNFGLVDLEDARVPAETQARLQLMGYQFVRHGEYRRVEIHMVGASSEASGVRRAVADPRGQEGSAAQNEPPVAAAEASATEVDRVRPVHFFDHSTDPDGRIVRWLWDFGDGTTSADQHPSHLYKQLGAFDVTLTVWDDYTNPFSRCCKNGASDTANVATITVNNIPPAGRFDGPGQGNGANGLASEIEANRVEPVRFEDASTDPDGHVASWAWDFGDGATSSAQDPEHQYATLGTFTARVLPTDNDGDAGTEGTRSVRVVNLLPSPDFTHHRTYPNVLEPVEFTDASSDRDGEVVAWVWDFGDGHTSEEVRPWHVFLRGGWHTVTLTAEDNDGGAAARTRSLYVCNPTGEYDALADPRHVRVEFQACLRLDGGDLPIVPMGLRATDVGGFPGLLWLLAGCLSVLTRRHQAGRRNERG